MHSTFTRRQFVQASGRLLAGAGAASLWHRAAAADQAKPTLAVASRDVFLKLTDRPDCWAAMQGLELDGVEATIRDDLSFPDLFHPRRKYSIATQAGIGQLASDLKAAGRRITAICTFNRFDDRPEFELDWVGRIAQAAPALGVKVIRIDVVPHKLQGKEFLDFSVGFLKKLIAATESTGVGYAIENHGSTSNNPDFLGPLFDRVGSPRLGLTLDAGNFYWFGFPLSQLYPLYEQFAPRVFHVHCKNIRYPEDQREKRRAPGWEYAKYRAAIYEGDVDYRRVREILRKAGYANDLCIDDEALSLAPADQHAAVLAKDVRFLKSLA